MKLSFLVKRISVSMLSTEPIANCTSVQKVKRSITRYRASLPPLHQYRQALLLVPPLDRLKHPAKNTTKTKKRLKLPLTTTMPRKRSEWWNIWKWRCVRNARNGEFQFCLNFGRNLNFLIYSTAAKMTMNRKRLASSNKKTKWVAKFWKNSKSIWNVIKGWWIFLLSITILSGNGFRTFPGNLKITFETFRSFKFGDFVIYLLE